MVCRQGFDRWLGRALTWEARDIEPTASNIAEFVYVTVFW